MGVSIFEAEAIREFATEYLKQFKSAIEKTQVKRQTNFKGQFSAPVNTTGSLANSGEWKFTGTDLEIRVNSYIRYLIFGRGANAKRPPITEIERWMSEKGITGVSPFAIANAMAKNGSSIFQKYRGQPSNLLDNIDLDTMLKKLSEKIGEHAANSAVTEILNEFHIANLD